MRNGPHSQNNGLEKKKDSQYYSQLKISEVFRFRFSQPKHYHEDHGQAIIIP